MLGSDETRMSGRDEGTNVGRDDTQNRLGSNAPRETLLQMLERKGDKRCIATAKSGFRQKLHVLLDDGVTRQRLVREVVPSTEEQKRTVAERIADAFLQAGKGAVTPSQRKAFFGVIEEALANAIRDGNRLNDNKHVTVVYGVMVKKKQGNQRFFTVYIEDEGAGFILEEVLSPDIRREEGYEGGMGLQIINGRLAPDKLNGNAYFLPMSDINRRSHEVFIEVPLPNTEELQKA